MKDLPTLSGPEFGPAAGSYIEQLVILCHGLGADGNDLIGLAPYYAQVLPNAKFISPNAPFPCDMAPYGYQWFSLQERSEEAMLAGAQMARPILDAFIDRQMENHGLAEDKLTLIGFSQGTMMALHTGLRREVAPAGILGFSGALPGPERLKDEMTAKPPIMLIHGDRDDVLPVGMTLMAAQGLAEAGHGAEFHISPGIPHSIGPDGLELGARFIANAFAGKLV